MKSLRRGPPIASFSELLSDTATLILSSRASEQAAVRYRGYSWPDPVVPRGTAQRRGAAPRWQQLPAQAHTPALRRLERRY